MRERSPSSINIKVARDTAINMGYSIIKEEAGTIGTSVPGMITINAVNLMGVPKDIKLKKVQEGDAIYYIGEFPITHMEIINFKLEVTPTGHSRPIIASFSQQFYVD